MIDAFGPVTILGRSRLLAYEAYAALGNLEVERRSNISVIVPLQLLFVGLMLRRVANLLSKVLSDYILFTSHYSLLYWTFSLMLNNSRDDSTAPLRLEKKEGPENGVSANNANRALNAVTGKYLVLQSKDMIGFTLD